MLRQYKTRPKNVETLLKRAKGIVQQGWCQGYAAINDDGRPVGVDSDDAVACCGEGALVRASLMNVYVEDAIVRTMVYKAHDILAGVTPYISLATLNDKKLTTKEDVIAAYDRAIEKSKNLPS